MLEWSKSVLYYAWTAKKKLVLNEIQLSIFYNWRDLLSFPKFIKIDLLVSIGRRVI